LLLILNYPDFGIFFIVLVEYYLIMSQVNIFILVPVEADLIRIAYPHNWLRKWILITFIILIITCLILLLILRVMRIHLLQRCIHSWASSSRKPAFILLELRKFIFGRHLSGDWLSCLVCYRAVWITSLHEWRWLLLFHVHLYFNNYNI